MSQDWEYAYSLDLCPKALLRETVLPPCSRCTVCHLNCRGEGGNGRESNHNSTFQSPFELFSVSAIGCKTTLWYRFHFSWLCGPECSIIWRATSLGIQTARKLSPTEKSWGERRRTPCFSAHLAIYCLQYCPVVIQMDKIDGPFFLPSPISFRTVLVWVWFFKWHECSS